jgi:hypothetical protein
MVPELQLPPKIQNNMTTTASADYLDSGRRTWFHHACEITRILRLALDHAPNSMGEPNTAGDAYTAIRTQLYYSQFLMKDDERQRLPSSIEDMIDANLRYLRALHQSHPSTQRTLACSEELVRTLDPRSGGTRVAEEVTSSPALEGNANHFDNNSSASNANLSETSPMSLSGSNPRRRLGSQVSADSILHPLAQFRLLRNQIPEKHTPERNRVLSQIQETETPWHAAPFFSDPTDITQQQQQQLGPLWDVGENAFAWINADFQDNTYGMPTGWSF